MQLKYDIICTFKGMVWQRESCREKRCWVSFMAKKTLQALSISMSVFLGSSFIASSVSAETIVHNDRSHRKMIFEQDMAAAREAAARHSGYAKQAEAPVYPVQSEESVQPVEDVQPEREAAPLVEPDAKEAAPSAASNVEPAAEAPVTAVKEAKSSVETAETMPNRDTAVEAHAPVEAPAANSELAADAEETAANSEPAAAAEETAPVVEEAPPVPEGSSAIESVSVGEVPPVAEASASEPESEAVAPVQGEAVTELASEPAEPAGQATEAAESAAPAAEQPEEAKQLETVQQSEQVEQVIPAQAEEPQEIKVLMHDFVLSRYAQDSWVVKVLAKPDAPVYRPESEPAETGAEEADTDEVVSEV